MKKFFLLTSLAFSCCLLCVAQQEGHVADSAVGGPTVVAQNVAIAGDDSVFSNLSALVKDPGKVFLEWNVRHVSDGDYFIIERSQDGGSFETIGALRREGNGNHYELTDIAPPNGTDLYRIVYSSPGGHLVYSKTAQVSLSGAVDFKFYPNPVDKLLIIRTAHFVDIQIVDATGFVRLARHLPAGIQVINISSLEKGVYVLRVADKESNRIISSQLIKN
jgi:hypothetical protein